MGPGLRQLTALLGAGSGVRGPGRTPLFALAGALIITAAACSESADPEAAPPTGDAPPAARAIPVETHQVATREVVQRASAVGSITANESVVLRPEIGGRVSAINFEEGAAVERGAVLLVIDPAEYRAAVAQTRATVELNRLKYQRARDLVKSRMISQQEHDEAQARLKESQAALDRDQVRLAKTRIEAPFAGVIGLRHVSPGAYVQPGQDLANLEDLDPVKVEFQVSERYAPALATGQRLRLEVDAVPGVEFEGEIYAVNPRLNAATRSLVVRARVPNPERRLRPGMFARVELDLERRADAVVVPEEALVPVGDRMMVYRVVDGRVAPVPVTTGLRQHGEIEIVEGLQAGDTIITAGQMKVREGMPVVSVNEPQAAAPPQAAESADTIPDARS